MHAGELRVTHVHKYEDVHALVQKFFLYFPFMQICISDVRCIGRPKAFCTSIQFQILINLYDMSMTS